MKRSTRNLMAALWLAAAPALQAAEFAPPATDFYAVAAVGGTRYGFDCRWVFDCNNGNATTAKLVLGWHRGGWGVEGMVADFGRASTTNSIASLPGETLRVRATGLALTAQGRWSDRLDTVARLGYASATTQRSREADHRQGAPWLGLALQWRVAPTLGVELGWDYLQTESAGAGSVSVNAFTLGLAWHF